MLRMRNSNDQGPPLRVRSSFVTRVSVIKSSRWTSTTAHGTGVGRETSAERAPSSGEVVAGADSPATTRTSRSPIRPPSRPSTSRAWSMRRRLRSDASPSTASSSTSCRAGRRGSSRATAPTRWASGCRWAARSTQRVKCVKEAPSPEVQGAALERDATCVFRGFSRWTAGCKDVWARSHLVPSSADVSSVRVGGVPPGEECAGPPGHAHGFGKLGSIGFIAGARSFQGAAANGSSRPYLFLSLTDS